MKLVIILIMVIFKDASAAPFRNDLFNFLILHTNDMHARFEETSRITASCNYNGGLNDTCVGGFARVAHVVRQARERARQGTGPDVLFLNAGDTYTGTSWFTIYKWNITVEFMNLLEPDVMCLGNHEFDDGPEGLLPFLDGITFPTVTTNLDFTDVPELEQYVQKSLVIDLNGRKIGIVGYLTPQTTIISSPGKVKFIDEVESLIAETQKLHSEGVDIIIALGHSGFEADQRIAKNVPLVDVIVGGHSDTFLWNGPPPDLEIPESTYPHVVEQESGKRVPVVQAYGYTKYVGRLNVSFDSKGDLVEFSGLPLLLDSTVPQEEDVLARLNEYRPALEELQREVVGKTKVLLEGTSDVCRKRECNLGNLIADAFVSYFAEMHNGTYWTDTPIGLMNGGGIRNSIQPYANDGNISMRELLGVLPFDNQVVALSIKGKDLVGTLETAVRAMDGSTSGGEFLQVSGLHISYNVGKPSGNRVISVKVRCRNCEIPVYEEIQYDKEYRVATVNFIADGGDGHYYLQNNSYNRVIANLNDVNILAWYLRNNRFIYPSEEERLKFLTTNGSDLQRLSAILFIAIFTITQIA